MQIEKQSDLNPFGRYYKNKMVCDILVKAMNLNMPKVVIDLGVGCGALSTSAARTWISTEFITVDIDIDSNKAINGVNMELSHVESQQLFLPVYIQIK